MAEPFFSVTIDRADIERMTAMAHATDGQIERARIRALRKVQKPIERAIMQAASKKLRIPQKAIADRFFSDAIGEGDTELRVWIGTWALSPFSIGSPRQSKTGVKAGSRFYRGAFIGSVYTMEEKVWIRLRSPHYSSELYPTRTRPGDRGMAHNHRFPVVRAAVPIDGVVAEVLQSDGQVFADRFMQIFKQELNYEVNVRGRA
jgi:hypothetical protein